MANELTTVRRLIADDAHALTFQTFGQYRTALLKAIDALPPVAGEAVTQSAPTEAGGVAEALKWTAAALQAIVRRYEVEGVISRLDNDEQKPLADVLDMADAALSTLPAPSPEAVAGAIDARGQEVTLTDTQIDALFDPRDGIAQGLDEMARRFARRVEFFLKAPREQSPASPDAGVGAVAGWKLVPIEPTDAMEHAGQQERFADNTITAVYKAMLAAAPASAPEAPEQQREYPPMPAPHSLVPVGKLGEQKAEPRFTGDQMHAYVDADRKTRQLAACNFCLNEAAEARAALASPDLRSKLNAAANYIDTLGGDSKTYRAALAQAAPATGKVGAVRGYLGSTVDGGIDDHDENGLDQDDSGAAKDAGTNAGATGAASGSGANQHHQHRVGQADDQRAGVERDCAGTGLPGEDSIREAVAAIIRDLSELEGEVEDGQDALICTVGDLQIILERHIAAPAQRATPAPTVQAETGEAVDRSDAVNLARNMLTVRNCKGITSYGVRVLCDAVMTMDAALTAVQADKGGV